MSALSFPNPFVKSKRVEFPNDSLILYHFVLRSSALRKKLKVNMYVPVSFSRHHKIDYPTLLLNDGQDEEQLKLIDAITNCYENPSFQKFAVITIHANESRMNEYGVSGIADYANRGDKAHLHEKFVTRVVEFFTNRYGLFKNRENNVFAGFSLGGLSAISISWNRPDIFHKVGVFSGSFWWRSKEFQPDDPDANRIMHQVIRESTSKRKLIFWLEAGTKDEKSDRNKNGIIDAIDDTLDIIRELKNKGYTDKEITYLQIEGGEHNFHTWSWCFPKFLEWAFKIE